MTGPDAYPRPSPLAERIRLRGCRNCLFYHSSTERCAIQAPTRPCPSEGWCGSWRWASEPRVGWDSAFARKEFENGNNQAS